METSDNAEGSEWQRMQGANTRRKKKNGQSKILLTALLHTINRHSRSPLANFSQVRSFFLLAPMPSLNSLLVAAAGVSAALAATSCNPSYNYTEPSCINDCKLQAGQSISPDFTTDSKSGNFLTSISFQCNKSSPNYIPYMTAAGICFTSCNFDDQQAFVKNYQLECSWWQQHSNETCSNVTINDTNSVSSTTSDSSVTQLSTLGTVLALAGGIAIVTFPGLF